MGIIEYLRAVKAIPEWDRVPAISDIELDALFNIPPRDNPESECYGCQTHSMSDCENVRDDDWGEFMTVQEYNNDFLPRIERAKEFISLFESSIQHMDDKKVDKDEVKKQFKIRCWSNETKKTILDALHYYQQHEGLEKIRSSAER